MIFLQLVIYCVLFTAMVAYAVRQGAINGIYFYPKSVQERAIELGLTDRDAIKQKRKRFMILFYVVMLVALLLMIGVWNRVTSFREAYLQSVLFLEVMNWYDGIIIDKVWVGYSKFWVIPGTEDIPYVQTWKQVLQKRGVLTVIWLIASVLVAGIIVLF